jgi:hypothetical protein
MNHDVVITDMGNGRDKINIDRHELTCVVAYRIEKELSPVHLVTFTINSERVLMMPDSGGEAS